MLEFLSQVFDTADFPPRWQCGNWSPAHGWLHIVSDVAIWSAYFAIPCILIYLVRRRRDVPFPSIFWLFGAFILACGTTHLLEAVLFWHPVYRLAGIVKLLTAIISWATVFALAPIIPKALAMRSPEELEREIAARKQAEDALHEANTALETRVAERTADLAEAEQLLREADRRKDEFLAILSHELRNPLAPIRTGVDLLKRGHANAQLVGQVSATMERQVGHIVRLVDDLLDISRITTGKLHIHKELVSLAEIVHSAVETSGPLIDARFQELTVTLPPEPIHLDADPTRLSQVIANLLNNAAKYTGKGGRIWLSAEQRDGQAVVSVRDTGIGIAAEHLPRIFQMFSQATPALERSQGGLGIGLSLVRGLAELHGGTVEAQSAGAGQGSEFVLRLPVAVAPLAQRAEGAQDAPARAPKRRILLVDDNQEAAPTMALLLETMGHEVRTAFDGAEAVEVAEAYRPEVALLDIGLPKMNGYEVAQHFRKQPWGRGMTIIALTGWGQEEDKRRALEAGFDHHLIKPVAAATIEKLLVQPVVAES